MHVLGDVINVLLLSKFEDPVKFVLILGSKKGKRVVYDYLRILGHFCFAYMRSIYSLYVSIS